MSDSDKTKSKLSTLWLITALNILLADILSAYIAFGDPSVLNIIGDPKTMMAIAALILNLPIAMIFLVKILPSKLNRIANIVVAVLTTAFIVGAGSSLPHYIIIEVIEVIILLTIIYTAWKLPKQAV